MCMSSRHDSRDMQSNSLSLNRNNSRRGRRVYCVRIPFYVGRKFVDKSILAHKNIVAHSHARATAAAVVAHTQIAIQFVHRPTRYSVVKMMMTMVGRSVEWRRRRSKRRGSWIQDRKMIFYGYRHAVRAICEYRIRQWVNQSLDCHFLSSSHFEIGTFENVVQMDAYRLIPYVCLLLHCVFIHRRMLEMVVKVLYVADGWLPIHMNIIINKRPLFSHTLCTIPIVCLCVCACACVLMQQPLSQL